MVRKIISLFYLGCIYLIDICQYKCSKHDGEKQFLPKRSLKFRKQGRVHNFPHLSILNVNQKKQKLYGNYLCKCFLNIFLLYCLLPLSSVIYDFITSHPSICQFSNYELMKVKASLIIMIRLGMVLFSVVKLLISPGG